MTDRIAETIAAGIDAGLVKIDLVPGSARQFDVTITNGSATRQTTITARSTETAALWTAGWANATAAETGETWTAQAWTEKGTTR